MPPKKRADSAAAAAASGRNVPPPEVTLQDDGNGNMRISEVKIYLPSSPQRSPTPEKVVTTKSGRQVRAAKKPLQAESESEKEESEYEADEEEDEQVVEAPKRKARGAKRSYDDDADYGKSKKNVKTTKAPVKKGGKAAAPAKGKAGARRAPAKLNSSSEDEEEAGEKGNKSDDSDSEPQARKRPAGGRMTGAPPSARLGQKKKNNDSD